MTRLLPSFLTWMSLAVVSFSPGDLYAAKRRGPTCTPPSQAEEAWPDHLCRGPTLAARPKDRVVIAAIEDYAALPSVPGAEQSAQEWKLFFEREMGIPSANITLLRDEEVVKTKSAGLLMALQAATAATPADGHVWFVFVGHGAPYVPSGETVKDSEATTRGLLVAYDAQNTSMEALAERSFDQAEVVDILTAGGHAGATLLLDTCFSGASNAGDTLVKGVQPTVTDDQLKQLSDKPVLVVTAGRGDQYAGALPGEPRPAFSYLAIGGLRGWADRDGDGQVTAQELVTYANEVLDATTSRAQDPMLVATALPPTTVLSAGATEAGPDIPRLKANGVTDADRVRKAAQRKARATLVAGGTMLGLGVLTATLPVTMYLANQDNKKKLQGLQGEASDLAYDKRYELERAFDRNQILTWVGIGASAAFVITGTVLLATGRVKKVEADRLSFSPNVGRRFAGLALRGRF